jgi:ribonuclease P protein component
MNSKLATDNPNQAFPKRQRLLSRREFLAMNGQSQMRLMTGCFLIVVKPNRLSYNRLGVTVTKKVGKAVARNRFKRVAREFFRLNNSSWPQGFDLLFIALQGKDPFQKDLVNRARVKGFLVNLARRAQ